MTRCPTCGAELCREAIGGDRSNGSRPAMFCPACNTVWPDQVRHLQLVPERRRRDLDDLDDE